MKSELLKYDEWQPYVEYEKAECDIKLKDGRIIKHLYPNAGKFNQCCGENRPEAISEGEVAEIMYREYYMKALCTGDCNNPDHVSASDKQEAEETISPDKFFIIKLITGDNRRGYVIDGAEGIMISVDALVSDVKRFNTEKAARIFIKDRKLERQGTRAFIRSNKDLMTENESGVKPLVGDVYYFETESGEKICYDPKTEYYLDKVDVGYCCWTDMAEMEKNREIFSEHFGLTEKLLIKTIEKK